MTAWLVVRQMRTPYALVNVPSLHSDLLRPCLDSFLLTGAEYVDVGYPRLLRAGRAFTFLIIKQEYLVC